MAAKTTKQPSTARMVTAERAARLYQLIKVVGARPQTREQLAKRLKLDVRGFYRDLELLRSAGIRLALEQGRYTLQDKLEKAVALLPFPDPRLTLGEAEQLAKGRSAVHQKHKKQIDTIRKKR